MQPTTSGIGYIDAVECGQAKGYHDYFQADGQHAAQRHHPDVTISLLAEQTKKRKLKHILSVLQREMENGRVLSEAISIFPRTFPKYITSVIQVGKATGLLEESLDSVISLMEERTHISR